MDYIWIIEINTFSAVILGIILYSLYKNYDRQIKQRYYIKAVTFGIISFLCDINWGLIEGKILLEPRIINYLTNALYFISSTLTGYYWLHYVESSLDSRFLDNKLLRLLFKLPVLIVVVGVIVSYLNGFFFYIDKNNNYHRGDYVFIHVALCHLYTVVTSAHAFIRSLKTKVYIKSLEYRILAMFLIFPLLIGIIQVILPNIPTVSIGITLSFLFVYIDLQNLMISVDTLSGLNNRNQLMRYLTAKFRNDAENKQLYVFMLDVNKFKKINDTYGHVEGDAALIRCSKALKAVNKLDKTFVGRYGGDEFTIIAELSSDSQADEICKKTNEALAQICLDEKVNYDLSLSIGYAAYSPDMKNIMDFIAAADEKLYQAKEERNKMLAMNKREA